ncbi:MAG TPA: hypothetical protein H9986_08385 [Candidatus Prevotella stercoripullorum]|nr:hypothetical protein [Candidatus Prevotella stercoripullorum]
MANRRKLKKTINYICSALFSECMAALLYNDSKKQEVADAILTSIIIVQSNYICRISHVEPGMSPRAYFKDLKDKFNIQVEEIADNIANI